MKRIYKKGIFYSIDAAIAMFILVGALVIFSLLPPSESNAQPLATKSSDFLDVLSSIKVQDADYPLIKEMIANGSISLREKDTSILGYVSELWAENETDIAEMILKNISKGLFDDETQIKVTLEDKEFFKRGTSATNLTIVSSSRTVTGITENQSIKGISARSYLTGIGNKITSAFVFIGGFVGQGNITKHGALLPTDANITGFYFEADLPSDAKLYVNGVICDSLLANSVELESTKYNLIHCNNSLFKGSENYFKLVFETDLIKSYVGGGFFEIEYRTKELDDDLSFNSSTFYFPGIEGLINFYSSITIPGDLKEMNISLHYDFNHTALFNETFFLTLGNKTVFTEKSADGDTVVFIDDATISSIIDYDDFDFTTMPIRLGYENVTYETLLDEGNADIILISDYSGSMKNAVDGWGQGNAGWKCDDTDPVPPDARRTELACKLGKDFVDIVLDAEGNRIWPVFIQGLIGDDVVSFNGDPTNVNEIKNYIGTEMNGQGNQKTCIACAINKAYDILDHYSNKSRLKFIVVMTDGSPTHCAQGSCYSNSTIYGLEQCEGLCDTPGNCQLADLPLFCNDCTVNDGAVNNTLYSAKRIKDDLNTTIHTIGFGPIGTCSIANRTMYEVAEIGNGTYNHSSNATVLTNIYHDFANEILTASRVSQIIEVESKYVYSELFDDSYISYSYIPSITEPPLGYMSIRLSTDHFNSCTPTLNLPDVLMKDTTLTSFSSKYWTDYIEANGYEVFNLSKFSSVYSSLGDPFVLNVPVDKLNLGANNNFVINVGDNPNNSSGCSPHSRLFYEALLPTAIPQSKIYNKAEGCTWLIEYDDGSTHTMNVPIDYPGLDNCEYSKSAITFDKDDAVNNAAYEFFKILDVDDDNAVDINIDENKFNIEIIQVNEIPSLFGPSRFKVVLSK